jgi:hypothetical protein
MASLVPYRSIFDLDKRSNGVTERVSMDVSQSFGYTLYPNSTHTEVYSFCENDGSEPPCDEGFRTVFSATTIGGGSDNPMDPDDLTEEQKMRSVVFSFQNASCWTFEFNALCPTEPEIACGASSGSILLFGGGASQIVTQGVTSCSDEEEERRDLKDETRFVRLLQTSETMAEVGGIGTATLMFIPGARRLERSTERKAGRDLQDGSGPKVDIEIVVSIETSDDPFGGLRTAGGTSASSGSLLLVLGLLVNAAILWA